MNHAYHIKSEYKLLSYPLPKISTYSIHHSFPNIAFLDSVDQWLEILSEGQSEVSTPASMCVIVCHSATSLVEPRGGRSFMAIRGWECEAWEGAEGAGVFLVGAGLFGKEEALVLPFPFSILDLLLASLGIGQWCHFSALCVVNLCPHNWHCQCGWS
jgi:hypothetical protein